MNAIPKIAPIRQIPQEEPERKNLETYLHIKLNRCESELFNLARKHGVSSIEDFEDGYRRGNIPEEETWGDFFRLDHLESKRESLKNALEIIQ